jgi:thiol-disulfide isomerase/thioredoxin
VRARGAAGLAVALLAAILIAVLIAAAGLIVSRGRPGPAGPEHSAAAAAPLGQFIPATAPKPAPPVSFTSLSGQTASLASFDGKLVVLNLWATWCAPCRREMPSLDRLQSRFGEQIAVVAVSEDLGGNKVVAPFVAKLGLSALKTYLDPNSAVGQAFKVDGLPTTFLIDRRGQVLGRVEGEADWLSPRMLAIITPLLSSKDIVKTSFPSAHP